jgi:hypothetical protein
MAKADSRLDSITRYLKTDFPWKKDFVCEPLGTTYQYIDVTKALMKIKITDPSLHRIASYRWMSYRTRNEIANSLYMDSSTLKRHWDKFGHLLMNYLNHGDLIGDMDPIDLEQVD